MKHRWIFLVRHCLMSWWLKWFQNKTNLKVYKVAVQYIEILYSMSKSTTFHFHVYETVKFPTIFSYKVVIIVLFTYLPCRDAVRINEIIPIKKLSSLEIGGDIKMLLLSCHSHISLLTLSRPQGRIKKKQILIHSEKYLMKFKKNFFPMFNTRGSQGLIY